MPLASLTKWLQNALMLLPGTYGTGLLHLHLMGGAIGAMAEEGVPPAVIEGMKRGFDCTLEFFGTAVSVWVSYLVLVGAGVLLLALCIFLHLRRGEKG